MGLGLNNEQFLLWILSNLPRVFQLNSVCGRYGCYQREEAAQAWECEEVEA